MGGVEEGQVELGLEVVAALGRPRAASPFVSFFEPFLKSLVGPGFEHGSYQRFAEMMENRDNVELLIIEIERENQRAKDAERQEKFRRKQLKKEARAKRRELKRARKTGRD